MLKILKGKLYFIAYNNSTYLKKLNCQLKSFLFLINYCFIEEITGLLNVWN